MNIFHIWSSFIFFIGVSESDDSHYFLFCSVMLYVTYIYNQIYYIKLTPKTCSLLLSIPSVILWWILYVYNYLLSLEPFSNEVIISIIFLYFYILLYIFWEYDKFGEYNSVG